MVSSPFESLIVTILATFYVDDGMPGVNDSQEARALPLELLLKQAEDATQSWERLLFASRSSCLALSTSEGRQTKSDLPPTKS
jgi:hypothetical protein